jgi:hypothetical protein
LQAIVSTAGNDRKIAQHTPDGPAGAIDLAQFQVRHSHDATCDPLFLLRCALAQPPPAAPFSSMNCTPAASSSTVSHLPDASHRVGGLEAISATKMRRLTAAP